MVFDYTFSRRNSIEINLRKEGLDFV